MKVTVGKEGQNDFTKIQAAVDFIEQQQERKEKVVTIEITAGNYEEQVRIYRSNVRLIGKGQVTIVAGAYAKERDKKGVPIGTFATATLFLGGQNYEVENLTIENNAGHGCDVGQAVALYAHCDKAVFRNCRLLGYQDTLCTGPLPPFQKDGTPFGGIPIRHYYPNYRQYYQNCRIEGTVDFIFGGATAYFEHCTLYSRKNKNGEANYVTAASTPKKQDYGFVFYRCVIETEAQQETYLGRPWRANAKTIFWHCQLKGKIAAAGWHHWDNPANEQTVDYQEVAALGQNVDWTKRPAWIKLKQTQAAVSAPEILLAFADWRMNRDGKEFCVE